MNGWKKKKKRRKQNNAILSKLIAQSDSVEQNWIPFGFLISKLFILAVRHRHSKPIVCPRFVKSIFRPFLGANRYTLELKSCRVMRLGRHIIFLRDKKKANLLFQSSGIIESVFTSRRKSTCPIKIARFFFFGGKFLRPPGWLSFNFNCSWKMSNLVQIYELVFKSTPFPRTGQINLPWKKISVEIGKM